MTLSTLAGAVDAYDIAAEERRKVREGALDLDRLAVEVVAHAYTMRTQGGPTACRSYRDQGGCVVVLKYEADGAWPLSDVWTAAVSALVESRSHGALTPGGVALAPDRGVCVFGFTGTLPRRRHTDLPGWRAAANVTRRELRRLEREAVAARVAALGAAVAS